MTQTAKGDDEGICSSRSRLAACDAQLQVKTAQPGSLSQASVCACVVLGRTRSSGLLSVCRGLTRPLSRLSEVNWRGELAVD